MYFDDAFGEYTGLAARRLGSPVAAVAVVVIDVALCDVDCTLLAAVVAGVLPEVFGGIQLSNLGLVSVSNVLTGTCFPDILALLVAPMSSGYELSLAFLGECNTLSIRWFVPPLLAHGARVFEVCQQPFGYHLILRVLLLPAPASSCCPEWP